MSRINVLIILLATTLVASCSSPHLDIFPELENPELTEVKINPNLLKEDIDAFYLGAMERHPNLDKYGNKQDIEQEIASLKKQINEPLNRLDFYKIVGQLTHKFNDGHSMLLWPYQELEQAKEAGDKTFPFTVTINQKDNVFLKRTYSNVSGESIPSGSKLISINGIPTKTLFESMQKYTGGESSYLRKQFVAGRIGIYLWAVYGFINEFDLELEHCGETLQIAVKKNDVWSQSAETKDSLEDFYYEELEEGVGYLYIGHFDVDPDWFEDFIDTTFARIGDNKTSSLIVDVRDNTGGNTDTATYLTKYLAHDKFRMISKINEKINPDNTGFLNYRGKPGVVIEEKWDDWEEPANSNAFHGDVYLLISPITYSSGIVFATAMKDHNFSTLIGQETGGNANQTAQGNLFDLPHSKLRAYITTRMLVRPNGSLAQGGVKPHYVTLVNEQTLANDNDNEVNKALQLIKSKRKGL